MLSDDSYCVWNAFQVVFVYFMFPETSGRTLEELAFCKCWSSERFSFANAFKVYDDDCREEFRRNSEFEALLEHQTDAGDDAIEDT